MSSAKARIGVVGGEGQMGRWLRGFWQGLGYDVSYSDRGSEHSNEDVVRWSHITFVAVPLRATPDVIRALVPALEPDRALVSIASLMAPSAQALSTTRGEALCAHPVFGPTVKQTRGLPVVVAPVLGSRWCDWLVATLHDAGLAVRLSTPEEHDAAMAVVQATLHSLYVALCTAMTDAGLPPSAALGWASPTLELQLGLIARILGQNPELYADLVVGNALAPDRLEELAAALQRLAALARAGDRMGFAAAFTAARAGFGDLADDLAERTEQALERFA